MIPHSRRFASADRKFVENIFPPALSRPYLVPIETASDMPAPRPPQTVLIVGAGEFGSTTALSLAEGPYRGHESLITVVERGAEPPALDAASSDYNKVSSTSCLVCPFDSCRELTLSLSRSTTASTRARVPKFWL